MQSVDIRNAVEESREPQIMLQSLDTLVHELKSGHLSIFAGAGLSSSSGYVDWKGLLKPVIAQLGVNDNIDLTAIAQYYKNEYGRHYLNNLIINNFSKNAQPNRNLEILSSLPISSYWTTNYDSLIEDTLRKNGKTVDVVIDQSQLKYHTPERETIVYKMHGDKTLPDYAVLTKNDYETYENTRALFSKLLSIELITNTFLFIGFSFSDPNLDRIISIVRYSLRDCEPKSHYCFMRSINKEDYQDENGEMSDAQKLQYRQDANLQALKIKDMRNYGIQTLLVNSFDQITEMLGYIKEKSTMDHVFISGGRSAGPTGYSPFGNNNKTLASNGLGKAEKFIIELSKKLIENRFKIVSGFGAGIGNYVVLGAFANKSSMSTFRNINENISIHPMITLSESESNGIEQQEQRQQLRETLIDNCGFVISIFGKYDYPEHESPEEKERKLKEDGTYIEYSIAKSKNKICIPVGATGFTSLYIHNIFLKRDVSQIQSEKLVSLYKELGKSDISESQLVDIILNIISFQKHEKEEQLKQRIMEKVGKSKTKEEQSERRNMDDVSNARIFLSFHYSQDHKVAREMREYIGANVVEEEEIKSQENIEQWINEKINDSDITILLIGKETANRRLVHYEIRQSILHGNPIVPICLIKEQSEMIQNPLQEHTIQGISAAKVYPLCVGEWKENLWDWIKQAFRRKQAFLKENKSPSV